jgi:hypothetical protein
MPVLSQVVTAIALLSSGALFGASLYDAVVLAPNLSGGPSGLEHGRLFMVAATPANLFRKLAPATQILAALSVALNWQSQRARWSLLGALIALILTDVITFTYHYPRNRLMFTAPLTIPPEQLARVARQWARVNWVRVVLILGSWLGTLTALMRTAV